MEPAATVSSLQARTHDVRIGTAGWSYKDWDGIFYPSGMQRRKQHPLEYLARFFDTTEINTSFYGPLKPELAKLWCRKVAAVNPRFLFTAKLYRAFTHSPIAVMEPTSAATIRPTDEDEIRTREGLDAIANEGRLGALLIQFPVSFKNTRLNREYLDRLLRQFIEYPRVVEVRDSSWNNAETLASVRAAERRLLQHRPAGARALARAHRTCDRVDCLRPPARTQLQRVVRFRQSQRPLQLSLQGKGTGRLERKNRKRRGESADHLRDHQQSLREQSRSQCAGVEGDDHGEASTGSADADSEVS